ncbi:SWIM zinc finger family protein [Nocardioides coralli]|uniref:SWIM zinc finger family protein n=1 Tax=Nocardioides coralli TaxID=2872154 RepID=UPI001CA39553|nr:SWIM zinc finger family protein [Nocardioides coralli]QZY29227.1 SWIM zinc finger family protein [Nocardioides coralli]
MATHPRIPPRRGARATSWWGKAWVRAVEEAAYDEPELKAARTLSRSGRIGAVTVDPGRFVASVEEGDDVLTVTGEVPVLDSDQQAAFVEAVAAESGRIGALVTGDLPHPLVEHAEEAGVELLPYGGELATRCSCEPWADPCHHALAVMYQLAWLVEGDPFVLLALRGIERDDLLARLHATAPSPARRGSDAEVLADARDRARRLLELLDDPDADLAALL